MSKGRYAHKPTERALLFVGTTKGVYVYDGDFEREKWKRTGPHIVNHAINSIVYDYRDQKTVLVATDDDGMWRTQDFGRSWEKVGKGLPSARICHLTLGHHTEPQSVWAGLKPAGLAKSVDGGATFTEVEGLGQVASAKEWWHPEGEPFVHSILQGADADHLHVAVSVAGVFRTEDGGKTWTSCNEGIVPRYPDGHQHADAHRDVHRLVANPARPERLYAIAHEGVYRTDDGGTSWLDVSAGLSSHRARSIVISPSKPNTIFVIPLGAGTPDGPKVEGQLAIYRSTSGGDIWDRLEEGLPSVAESSVGREAMLIDMLDEEGVYFATSRGALYVSLDDGESWMEVARGLAPVLSLEIIAEPE